MTSDECPGWTGRQLMDAALAAINRRPDMADKIKAAVAQLADREDADALDPEVLSLLRLVDEAGVAVPKLLPRNPRDR